MYYFANLSLSFYIFLRIPENLNETSVFVWSDVASKYNTLMVEALQIVLSMPLLIDK